MKSINTTAVCIPADHYIVDLSERVREIREMIDEQKFFSINRGRQYGKTTTIAALETGLSSDYDVISIDFQDATDAQFQFQSKKDTRRTTSTDRGENLV